MASSKRNKDEHYRDIFRQFCESSTVHGTFFWHAADTVFAKAMWVVVVLAGIGTSAFIINKSFMAWRQNPVITSVAQIPIEQVPFPSVTICPQGNTAFGYPEIIANEKGISDYDLGRALIESVLLIMSSRPLPNQNHCLVRRCQGQDEEEDCPDAAAFSTFMAAVRAEGEIYNLVIKQQLVDKLSSAQLPPLKHDDIRLTLIEDNPDCQRLVRDFDALNEIEVIFQSLSKSKMEAGSLLRWLYNHLDETETKNLMFQSFFNSSAFPELYSAALGTFDNKPMPDLVQVLTEKDSSLATLIKNLQSLKYDSELLQLMRLSLHPPHLAEWDQERKGLNSVPNAAFPFCFYQDETGEGLEYGPYKEHYCHAFQMTMNEKGLCYTYNNFNLGSDPTLGDEVVKVRNVKGCGKSKGLQLVVDSQKWRTKRQDTNFIVFVTVPGVITHKVSFTVDPRFNGEHHFYLHGIHYIDSSKEFKSWNRDALVCYFPQDLKLDFFSFYTQDNCLLECRYKKISAVCGCSPWYLNQTKHPVCGVQGNICFNSLFKNYQEDLQDITDCDCRSDCEGIHFFSSMNRYPFTDSTATDVKVWWDSSKGTGRLANYLLDPLHAFNDELTKNLTKMMHNMTDVEFANARFHNDISILNFFFDTPIITRITLEMRITIFDQISAIGGTLGLFTGVSLITFVEIFYWGIRLLLVSARKANGSLAGAGPRPTVITPEGVPQPNIRSNYKNPYLVNPFANP